MNSLNIVGRITNDLELKTSNSGISILKFNIAYNEKIKNNDMVYYFTVACFGKQAEIVAKYFNKGNRIGIGGKITQSRYQDKQGNKRSNVEIFMEKFYFIETKKDSQSYNNQNSYNHNNNNDYPAWTQKTEDNDEFNMGDNQVPF